MMIAAVGRTKWYGVAAAAAAAAVRCQSARHFSTDDLPPPLLVSLHQARLGYYGQHAKPLTPPMNLDIRHPTQGGHVLLGRNGMGKTLVSNVLSSNSSDYLKEGSYTACDETIERHADYAIAHVSFQSHEELLQHGGTAWQAISGGGNLSKAAQFLVVRFGLFPLLHREVDTLSTGEIRKVLLIKALSKRPKLLVLDNAFDGLDVISRDALRDLVAKTLRGFRQDILVQAVNSRATAHTQILLITHRAEEIVEECEFVTLMDNESVVTEGRNGRSGDTILSKALGMTVSSSIALGDGIWDEPSTLLLPTKDDISTWWKTGRLMLDDNDEESSKKKNHNIVNTTNLCIHKGEATLLQDLNWTVKSADKWLVAGGNGAGKSTLSRFLAARTDDAVSSGKIDLVIDDRGIGWVSTELHIATSRSERKVRDVVTNNGEVLNEVAMFVYQALIIDDQLLDRQFSELSQGEQKLVLIASALALRPQLLVLDEPCQGLDLLNRRRVLGLVERLCQSTDMSLVYISHHMEEVIPSVTHVLHLVGGKAVYNGKRNDYDPDTI